MHAQPSLPARATHHRRRWSHAHDSIRGVLFEGSAELADEPQNKVCIEYVRDVPGVCGRLFTEKMMECVVSKETIERLKHEERKNYLHILDVCEKKKCDLNASGCPHALKVTSRNRGNRLGSLRLHRIRRRSGYELPPSQDRRLLRSLRAARRSFPRRPPRNVRSRPRFPRFHAAGEGSALRRRDANALSPAGAEASGAVAGVEAGGFDAHPQHGRAGRAGSGDAGAFAGAEERESGQIGGGNAGVQRGSGGVE